MSDKVRTDAEQVLKLDEVTMPTVKAIASAVLSGGSPAYYCTIGGKKVAIIR